MRIIKVLNRVAVLVGAGLSLYAALLGNGGMEACAAILMGVAAVNIIKEGNHDERTNP